MKAKRGLFITVEGIEGAGKSTVVAFINEFLKTHKVEFVVTREFGGTEIAEKIRHVILSHHNEVMCDDTELLLAFAARAQHLAVLIIPALTEGKWVLCDRFTDSSYAYQGGGRGILAERISTIENWVQGDLRPDFTILLDIDPEISFARIKTKTLDRIEVEKKYFFQKIRECYLERAKREPKRFRIVDANQDHEGVLQQLVKILEEIVRFYVKK
jgi:dTMP kinase